MINNGWDLISFGTEQQPSKCYVDRIPIIVPICSKRGEQPKSHSTDRVIFDSNDSPNRKLLLETQKRLHRPPSGATNLNLPCLYTHTHILF